MELTPKNKDRKLRTERNALMAGMLLLIFSLIVLYSYKPSADIPNTPDRITCDAEHTLGNDFHTGDHKFEGANYQSSVQARSGSNSLRFPADGNTHYGFTTVIENPQAGEVYEAYVWSLANISQFAKLAVQGREPSGFYQESGEVVERDVSGWNLHRVRFTIPFKNTPRFLSIYVYSTGIEEVFFDDLLIQKVDLWKESDFKPRQLKLNFSNDAIQQLSDKRNQALGKGLLITNDDDWVKAELETDNNQKLEVKLRLKGDLLDHLRGNKWSYRVKLKGNDAWDGMQTFSLHSPGARYFLHEWLLHKWWKEQDVLTPRYDFVELFVNGDSRGIYAYEEHFQKQLIESQERREGPIIKFSEEGYWSGADRQLSHHGLIRSNSGIPSMSKENAPIKAFNENDMLADPVQQKYFREAQLLLEQFRNGMTAAADVFDLDKLARYYAGCDLLNAYHGIVWHNQRFYYNPILGKLEPIGFDGFGYAPGKRFHFLAEGALHPDQVESTSLPAQLMRDTAFIRHYINVLLEESEPDHWQNFINQLEVEWQARLSWIQMEFPEYNPQLATIGKEVAFVRSHILPFTPTTFSGYRDNNGQLMVTNTHTLPVIIKGYGNTDQNLSRRFSEEKWLPSGPIRKLRTRIIQDGGISNFREIRYSHEQALILQTTPQYTALDVPASTRYLYYQLPGLDSTLVAPIQISASPDMQVSSQQYRTASLEADFPNLRWNKQQKQVIIPEGQHQLNRDLIIAADHDLVIAAGAQIDLINRAAIISYGAIQAKGEEDLPIIINSSDGTGQGLQVLQAPKASLLHRVTFSGLRNLHKGSWMLTGAVTFLESPVKFSSCVFTDNQSEDALNLVRSGFEMDNCLFQNTASDGFDSDFCKGTLTDCYFLNTTNDGLDVSGSIITAENCRFEGCGDKGISAGEASDVTAIFPEIKGCVIGVASKDRSTVLLRDPKLEDCDQGLVAFQKKPEFGPALMVVEGLEAKNIGRLYQIGPGSRLQIDDEVIEE